ncbi:MAG: hypothetical protein JW765_01280 [Deltaproteobacteria bacterium]|nr:hypothetical protein [Candidatus Zymogenaceae bacterium]
MDHISLLKAAVFALVAVGLSIGIYFFVFAYLYVQSIRGKDIDNKLRSVKRIVLILFTAFVGIFAVIRCALTP